MAKQEKEIERWVTVNGVRVPIFKDGSVGGPKALRDKVKASQNKSTDKKVESSSSKQPTEQEMRDFIKSKGHEKFVDELSGHTEKGYKQALQYVYDQDTLSKEEFRKKYFGDDTKEKQIAKNKAEADDRNDKNSAQYKWYEQAKAEGRVGKDEPFKKYIDYSPLPKKRKDAETKTSERTANQTREEELKSTIKQLEKNAFNKDARAVLNELRARVDEHRRFESDREDMQARLKSLKAKEKELTKTSAFKPEARQTLKELRARIEEIQLMERNDAHELTSYKRKK